MNGHVDVNSQTHTVHVTAATGSFDFLRVIQYLCSRLVHAKLSQLTPGNLFILPLLSLPFVFMLKQIMVRVILTSMDAFLKSQTLRCTKIGLLIQISLRKNDYYQVGDLRMFIDVTRLSDDNKCVNNTLLYCISASAFL